MKTEKQWVMVDNFKRKLFLKFEFKLWILKYLLKSLYHSTLFFLLIKFKKNFSNFNSITKINSRCILSGRHKNTNTWTKLSRFRFRTESYKGFLVGMRKSSW